MIPHVLVLAAGWFLVVPPNQVCQKIQLLERAISARAGGCSVVNVLKRKSILPPLTRLGECIVSFRAKALMYDVARNLCLGHKAIGSRPPIDFRINK